MQRLPVGQSRDWMSGFWCGLSAGLAVLLWLAGGVLTAHAVAPALCVDPTGTGGCYTTIQAAVDAAVSGDTITIAAGTHKNGTVIISGKTSRWSAPGKARP